MSAHISGELRKHFEKEIGGQIENLDADISAISDEQANNKSEIIREILQVYISERTKQQLQFTNQNNALYNLDQVVNDESLFIAMLKTSGLYVRTVNYGVNIASIDPSSAKEILHIYTRRSEILDSKTDGKLNALIQKKEQLQKQMRRLEACSPGVLIQKMRSEGFGKWVSANLGIVRGSDVSASDIRH